MMATIVFFHAHPDDECIITGGTMAQLSDQGHRVVLVTATGGELGEVHCQLDDGEELGQRRACEVAEAARVLGAARQEFLGYRDSGMAGTPANQAVGSFWQADIETAALRLAGLLAEEKPDALTVYDEHGVYGHPDHVQVHRVGMRAGELAGIPRVLMGTQSRPHIRSLLRRATEQGMATGDGLDVESFGVPDERITTAIDVSAYLDRKRAAMRAHASQIPPDSIFLSMPDEVFAAAFGTEWYILAGAPPGRPRRTSLLD